MDFGRDTECTDTRGRKSDIKCVIPRLWQSFAGSVDFAVSPAVRSAKGACTDESNCDWERATLCAERPCARIPDLPHSL